MPTLPGVWPRRGTATTEPSPYRSALSSNISLGTRIEFERWRIDGRKFLCVRGNSESFGLHRGIEGVLKFFTGEENRNADQIHQTPRMIQVDVRKNDPADFVSIAANQS